MATLFYSVLMCNMEKFSSQEFAFLGDAVHTLFVREYVLKNSGQKINEIQKTTSKFCSAKHQSWVFDFHISKILTEEEMEIFKRARNSKSKHTAKNCSPIEYAKATGFESLIGWLYHNKKNERLNQILSLSIKQEENTDAN